MTAQILQLKNELAEARQSRASLKDALAAVMKRREEEVRAIDDRYRAENLELFTDFKDFTAKEMETENALRAALIQNFETTGEKTFDGQLSVRVNTKLQYDEKKAVEWCEQYAPICIKKIVDAKLFEPFAKQGTLDFVTVIEMPVAVIAKDLSEEKRER